MTTIYKLGVKLISSVLTKRGQIHPRLNRQELFEAVETSVQNLTKPEEQLIGQDLLDNFDKVLNWMLKKSIIMASSDNPPMYYKPSTATQTISNQVTRHQQEFHFESTEPEKSGTQTRVVPEGCLDGLKFQTLQGKLVSSVLTLRLHPHYTNWIKTFEEYPYKPLGIKIMDDQGNIRCFFWNQGLGASRSEPSGYAEFHFTAMDKLQPSKVIILSR